MLLPVTTSNAKLPIPLTHSVDGIETPQKGQKRSLSTVVFLCQSINGTGLVRIKSFMVGCVLSNPLKGWPFLFAVVSTRYQSTAQDLRLKAGGLYSKKGHKPMLKNSPKQNPLTNSVSETKQKSLLAQVSIIRSAINIHGLTQTQENFNTLKSDALELVRMLDEIEQNNKRKTSLFNVLAKGTRRVIAEKISFNQAKQYPDAVVKFAGMEALV
jgi:hypothetical protein